MQTNLQGCQGHWDVGSAGRDADCHEGCPKARNGCPCDGLRAKTFAWAVLLQVGSVACVPQTILPSPSDVSKLTSARNTCTWTLTLAPPFPCDSASQTWEREYLPGPQVGSASETVKETANIQDELIIVAFAVLKIGAV